MKAQHGATMKSSEEEFQQKLRELRSDMDEKWRETLRFVRVKLSRKCFVRYNLVHPKNQLSTPPSFDKDGFLLSFFQERT